MEDYEKHFNRVLYYLQIRSRSEKEIRDYLAKKKASQEITERIITRLEELQFLDDAVFAQLWVESRRRSNPKSTRVIILELRKKGITDEIIEEVTQDKTSQTESDLRHAYDIVRKKLPKHRLLEKHEIYQKLGGMLVRRGFDWEIAKRAIDDVLKEEYNTKE